jgi:hypothetical protein
MQACSYSADSYPKAEPKDKGSLPYITLRAGLRNEGYNMAHTWLHAISLAILMFRVR